MNYSKYLEHKNMSKSTAFVHKTNFIVRTITLFLTQGLFVTFALFLTAFLNYDVFGIANIWKISKALGLLYIIFLIAILPILSEYMIRRERRKYGLPIYKAVTPDMIAEAEVAREYRAKQNLGIDESSGAVDKTDIRYWHGLLKDGIIDQDEFNKKKKELV